MVAAADARRAAQIGRRARLELLFAYRRGRTALVHAYAEPPFRVGRLLEAGPFVQLILASSGPGVFAGDVLEQRIRVERGARVLLMSQAALQVHPAAAAAAARLHSVFEVEGELDCTWDAVIPFANARLDQRFDLQLADGSRLWWSDALMSGRVARGEAWRFEAVAHELRTTIAGRLEYLERYRIRPHADDPAGVWRAGGANYLGTTIVYGDEATADLAAETQRQLAAVAGVHAGVDCPAHHLCVARLLAAGGPEFSRARALLRQAFARPRLRR
jgi:urease accessory protein